MCPDRRLRLFRSLVFASCLALFLAHSSREVDKYLTGLTSTSIRSYDDKELSFPVIVVCHKLPFKSGRPIMSREDYEELVYDFQDILDAERFFPSLDAGNLTVKVLDSLW